MSPQATPPPFEEQYRFSGLTAPEQEHLMAWPTVLLAEDDMDLRYVMECTLRSMGCSVISCADAQLASLAFRSHPSVDLLMTDFNMPGRTGLELARELTALRPTLRVMIVTGSILPDTTMQELESRRWTYVSKPCHPGALTRTLQVMLHGGQFGSRCRPAEGTEASEQDAGRGEVKAH